MMSRIRERKLVQWLIAYLAGSWLALQVVDFAGEVFDWGPGPLRVSVILVLLGVPAVVILGWYHGEQGRQEVTPLEAGLLSVLAVLGGFTLNVMVDPADASDTEFETVRASRVALDSTRYVVLPFQRQTQTNAELHEDLLLHDALGRWRGIEVVELFRVRDAVSRLPGSLTLLTSREVALGFGAGRFLRGDLTVVGSRIRLHASLHDTRTGRVIADTTVALLAGTTFGDSIATEVATWLLFRGAGAATVRREIDPATTSFPARLAFLHGHDALERWDLERADSFFAAALREDPQYARAALWRAQVRNWNGDHPRELRALAEIAAASPGRLTDRERLLSEALVRLAREYYPEACGAYEKLRKADTRDFAAWYGLGECRAHDIVVILDGTSPSGWAFRGSYHAAVQAYLYAFELLPSIHRGFGSRTFDRLRDVLFLSTGRFREGRAEDPDTARFSGQPISIADTLSFVPYPLADFSGGRVLVPPAEQWNAVEHQRRQFLAIASLWARAFPDSPEALMSLAFAYELLGDPRALETLQTARTLTTDPRRTFNLMSEQVKLLIKFGAPQHLEFARSLADSALDLGLNLDDRTLEQRAVLAALVGRAADAADFAARAAQPLEWPVHVPLAVAQPAARLTATVAMGESAEATAPLEQAVDDVIRARVSAQDQQAVRHVLLDRAASLSFLNQPLRQALELSETANFPLLQAQGAWLTGDTTKARLLAMQVRHTRRQFRPTEVGPEVLLAEAWLWTQMGDTATAVAVLDSTLEALEWLEPGAVADVPRAASLIRAMAFRAALARDLNDQPAKSWLRAARALWPHADPYIAAK